MRTQAPAHRLVLPGAGLLFLGLGLLTHLDGLLGPYGFIDFYDTVEVHFSHFQRMAQLFWEYGPYSWYPFHGGGVPAFVGQHPPYHPAVFLSAVLPIWLLALLWNISQTALAGWGMARLLRSLTGISRELSLFCGALFALANISGNVHIFFAYAFPAFAVLTLEAFDPSLGRGARFLRCLGLLLLSMLSFPVLTLPHFPVFHLALVLFFGQARPDWKRQIAGVFLVWTGYVLLFLPSIASLFLFIPLAQRDWDFPAVSLATALASYLWALKGRLVELTMFPLLLPSIVLLRRDRRAMIALALVLASLLVACFFGSDMKNFLANTFVVKMDLFLASMVAGCASYLLAALALDSLAREPRMLRLFWGLALASCLLRKGEYSVINGLLVVLAAGAALALLRSKGQEVRGRALWVALLALALAGNGIMTRQQYVAASSFVPFRPFASQPALAALAQEARHEPFRVGCIDVHPALVQAYGLDTVGGKSPLFNKYYKEFVQVSVASQLTSAELRKGFGSVWRQLYLTRAKADHDQRPLVLPGPQREPQEFNLPMLEAMGVRYLVSARPLKGFDAVADLVSTGGSEALGPSWFRETEVGRTALVQSFVYRLKDARPLGFLAPAATLAPGTSFLAGMTDSSGLDLRRTILIEDAELAAGHSTTDPGSARLSSWSPDRLVFDLQAAGPCLLQVANNFDERWSATLDGRPVPLLRANHAFQALAVDSAGPHTAVLEFHAPLIWWLHLGSLAGVALLFSALWLKRTSPAARETLPGAPLGSLAPCWRSVFVGSAFALVWAAGFSFFVLRKVPTNSGHSLSLTYALWTLPLLGPAIGLWSGYLARLLRPGAAEKDTQGSARSS